MCLVMRDNVENSGPNQYQSQWQAFRRRRNRIAALLFAQFLAFLPFVLLGVAIERRLFSTDKMAFPAAMLWGAV